MGANRDCSLKTFNNRVFLWKPQSIMRLSKQESQTPITFSTTPEDAPGLSIAILKPCLCRSNSFLVYLYPAGDPQSPCHHIPTLTFKPHWGAEARIYMVYTHRLRWGVSFFSWLPTWITAPSGQCRIAFEEELETLSALSEQIKGELSNPVVVGKREVSASRRLFTALAQLGWGSTNHRGAPAKAPAPPHAPVCQRSRTLPKQHLLNIQIPGNSHTPCCHPGFLRLWFPMCLSQSWTPFFQLVGRQLLERLEGQALGEDMGISQHFSETEQWDKLPSHHNSLTWMQGSAWQYDPPAMKPLHRAEHSTLCLSQSPKAFQ